MQTLALPVNIIQVFKRLLRTNTLAYFVTSSRTEQEVFMSFTLAAKVIKLMASVNYEFS